MDFRSLDAVVALRGHGRVCDYCGDHLDATMGCMQVNVDRPEHIKATGFVPLPDGQAVVVIFVCYDCLEGVKMADQVCQEIVRGY